MDTIINQNYAELSGIIAEMPVYSHENRGERFFQVPISIKRLSGTMDTIQIIVREKLLPSHIQKDTPVHVFGQVRSFNNKSSVGPKLVLSVFAREFLPEACEDRNDILLEGTICKQPNHRKTPLGREICDFMLAVNRKYHKSDYIPCIAWGSTAREIARLQIGTTITISGRMQSRTYIKIINDQPIEKTAYEISVTEYE